MICEPAMRDHQALLTAAGQLVDGGGPRHIHMACWLGRQAFEVLLSDFADEVAPGLQCSTRSRLAVVIVGFEGTELPQRAVSAWANLSRASHLAAYELTPTQAEVRGWLDDVHHLADMHVRLGLSDNQLPGS